MANVMIMTIDELKPIIESLIFVSEEPISVKQLAALLEGENAEDIEAACRAASSMSSKIAAAGLRCGSWRAGISITTRPESANMFGAT